MPLPTVTATSVRSNNLSAIEGAAQLRLGRFVVSDTWLMAQAVDAGRTPEGWVYWGLKNSGTPSPLLRRQLYACFIAHMSQSGNQHSSSQMSRSGNQHSSTQTGETGNEHLIPQTSQSGNEHSSARTSGTGNEHSSAETNRHEQCGLVFFAIDQKSNHKFGSCMSLIVAALFQRPSTARVLAYAASA